MPYSITFDNVTPPARTEADAPWTIVHVEEALVKEGPWLDILTTPIVAGDPTEPATFGITANTETISGWYRLVFEDITGVLSQPTEPTLRAPEYTVPSIRDVADKITARTRTRGGALAETFTADTIPTGDRVARLIQVSRDEVIGRTGPLYTPLSIRSARNLMAIYTAMQIELSYYSEAVNLNKSAYPELKKLWDEGMAALIESLGAEGESAIDETAVPLEPTASGSPFYDFPPTSIGDGVMP